MKEDNDTTHKQVETNWIARVECREMYGAELTLFVNETLVPYKELERQEWKVEETEEQIDYIMTWYGEARDFEKTMMKADLEELNSFNSKYILSSLSTNSYLELKEDETSGGDLREILENYLKHKNK